MFWEDSNPQALLPLLSTSNHWKRDIKVANNSGEQDFPWSNTGSFVVPQNVLGAYGRFAWHELNVPNWKFYSCKWRFWHKLVDFNNKMAYFQKLCFSWDLVRRGLINASPQKSLIGSNSDYFQKVFKITYSEKKKIGKINSFR